MFILYNCLQNWKKVAPLRQMSWGNWGEVTPKEGLYPLWELVQPLVLLMYEIFIYMYPIHIVDTYSFRFIFINLYEML